MNRNNPFVEGAPRILGVQHSLCLDYVEGTFTSVEAEVAECSERPISRPQLAARLPVHQPVRLFHSYFPSKRQLLLEQLVQTASCRLIGVFDEF